MSRRESDTASAELRFEPLATPFAPADAQVTVATPSCCCCCCCCLVSLTTAASFTAAEANLQAKHYGGNRTLATIVGLLAVPAALLLLFAADLGDEGTIFLPIFLLMGLAWLAFAVARVPTKKGLAVALTVGAVTAGAAFIEFWVALFTVFIVELLAPFGIWAGISWARGRETSELARVPRPGDLTPGPFSTSYSPPRPPPPPPPPPPLPTSPPAAPTSPPDAPPPLPPPLTTNDDGAGPDDVPPIP